MGSPLSIFFSFFRRTDSLSVSLSESCLLAALHPVKVYVWNSSWHHIYQNSLKQLLKGKHSGVHSACKDMVSAVSIHCFQITDVSVKDFLFLSTLFSAAGVWETGRNPSEWYSTANLQQTRSKKGWDLQEQNVSVSFERPDKSFFPEWKAVKEKLCQKTKTVLMQSECFCSSEPFLQLSFLHFWHWILGLMHFSRCLTLPCWSLWKKIPIKIDRRRIWYLVLGLSRRCNSFLAYA